MFNMQPMLTNILGVLLRRFYPHVTRFYWDARTDRLIKKYRTGVQAEVDYPIYRAYLEKALPKRLLDLGCGSGRLFPLYAELRIPEVIGIDISPRAISKVKPYPNCTAQVMKVEDLNFPPNYFDAAISNAVLRYVPPGAAIAKVISSIAEQCKSVLLREPMHGRRSPWDFHHDYEALFQGRMRLEQQYLDESVQDGSIYILIFVKDSSI